jgi:two-component system sensor histidine kinase MtrB
VAVAVRDYGIGLAPGEERLVFDRFWRADPARARTTGGTGLGLAIALEDARIHGGWLEAWGEAGRGSVFRLTLPRTVGAELAGSPLPLGPDEAELVDGAVSVTLVDATLAVTTLAAVTLADPTLADATLADATLAAATLADATLAAATLADAAADGDAGPGQGNGAGPGSKAEKAEKTVPTPAGGAKPAARARR